MCQPVRREPPVNDGADLLWLWMASVHPVLQGGDPAHLTGAMTVT